MPPHGRIRADGTRDTAGPHPGGGEQKVLRALAGHQGADLVLQKRGTATHRSACVFGGPNSALPLTSDMASAMWTRRAPGATRPTRMAATRPSGFRCRPASARPCPRRRTLRPAGHLLVGQVALVHPGQAAVPLPARGSTGAACPFTASSSIDVSRWYACRVVEGDTVVAMLDTHAATSSR